MLDQIERWEDAHAFELQTGVLRIWRWEELLPPLMHYRLAPEAGAKGRAILLWWDQAGALGALVRMQERSSIRWKVRSMRAKTLRCLR